MSHNERFDDSVDNATHAVMNEFDWLLHDDVRQQPDLEALMIKINDAITTLMNEFK